MGREKIKDAILLPFDFMFEKWMQGLEQTRVFRPVAKLAYKGMQKTLLASFKLRNELEVEGAENVPEHGGVILASNHQSWLDVQVLGATCP